MNIELTSPMTPEDLQHSLQRMRVSRLLTMRGSGARATVDVYHPRIRSGVLLRLDGQEHRRAVDRLASAFEESGSYEATVLSSLWEQAGDPGKAAEHAASAAETAALCLAFDRAAKLYERVIELGGRIAGLWDFNGDGLANDLLWRHTGNGKNSLWLMHGTVQYIYDNEDERHMYAFEGTMREYDNQGIHESMTRTSITAYASRDSLVVGAGRDGAVFR